MIPITWIRISDLGSLGAWPIKGKADHESLSPLFPLDKASAVPLMRHDPSDCGSLTLIGIIPKKGNTSLKKERRLIVPVLPQ